jgi:hypothetical protein
MEVKLSSVKFWKFVANNGTTLLPLAAVQTLHSRQQIQEHLVVNCVYACINHRPIRWQASIVKHQQAIYMLQKELIFCRVAFYQHPY